MIHRRKAVILAAILLLASGWLVVRTRREPSMDPAGGTAAESRGATGLIIEIPLPRLSEVERLREKTVAGTDRFAVEGIHEAIEPRLEELKRFLLAPSGASAASILDGLLAPDFKSSPLLPAAEKSLRERDGVSVARAVRTPGGGEIGRAGLAAEAAAFIRPLPSLDLAALKVIEVDGDADRGPVRMRALYELGGTGSDGQRRQWTGTAVLSWRKDPGASASTGASTSTGAPGEQDPKAWRLAGLELLDGLRSTLESAPFEDSTRTALAGSASLETLLLPGIDEFRERLDAASGIDVYGHHGLAVGDVDGDRIDDFYVAMPPGIPNLLYRGRGDGTFEEIGAMSGADALDGTSQPLFIDLENDGDQDLLLVTEAGLLLLENDGKGRFRETQSGLPPLALSRSTPISAAAADYDLDGFLDVYVASYVFWRGAVGEVGSRLPFPYHEAQNGAPDFLFRNRGSEASPAKGRFEDVTARSGLDKDNNRFSFAASWADHDGDGDPDLYVANDFGSNNLYRNDGDGTFTEVTREAGVEDIGAGMSVAWEDYDGDGDMDLYVGNMFSSAGRRVTGTPDYKGSKPELQKVYREHARGNSLFRNRGDGTFDDVSGETGAYFGRWAWASGFIDFDLDGREDIYVQNGFITNQRAHDL